MVYGADRVQTSPCENGAFANIPPTTSRHLQPCFSTRLDRVRNPIERVFAKLKHFPRMTTPYDKLAENHLAMGQLTAMHRWLRVCQSAT